MGGVTDKPEKGLVWVISSTPPSADQWRLARPEDIDDGGVYGAVYRGRSGGWRMRAPGVEDWAATAEDGMRACDARLAYNGLSVRIAIAEAISDEQAFVRLIAERRSRGIQ